MHASNIPEKACRAVVLGIPVDTGRMDEMIERLTNLASGDGVHTVTYLNPDCVNLAFRRPELVELYRRFDIVLPDGIGVVWAARRAGANIPERLAITDMLPSFMENCSRRKLRVFLLGAKPGVAETMAEIFSKKYPGSIAGFHNGYFTVDENENVIAVIKAAAPDVLLVGMGAPMQEKWVFEHSGSAGASLCICVGGLFDFYSENIPRAPRWMIRMHIEWLYRMIREPRRLWKRYLLGNISFIIKVLAGKSAG